MPLPEKIVLCQYRYDALNWLVSHLPVGAPQHQRFYCKSRLATEIQGTVRHSIFQQDDLLLAQQRSGDGVIDTSLLATDQQRSVLHTLKANQQRQRIAYSPYGHRPAENGLLSLLGFNGERPDPVTGHYLLGNGYRAFNPVLMRFNSPDSWSPFGKGGLNFYSYCVGNPINTSDPTGHVGNIVKLPNNSTSRIITYTYNVLPPIDFTLRPGVSRAQGEAAILLMERLNDSISKGKVMSTYYDKALQAERIKVHNETTLQKIAIKSIQSNSIPTNSLPNRLRSAASHVETLSDRHTLLEYLNSKNHDMSRDFKNSNYSYRALLKALDGEFDSSAPSIMHPTPEAAQTYFREIIPLSHPNENSVQAEISRIRDIHFFPAIDL
ncbi:RHS repeat-associated core domain-containing protein [Pseudomonas sp. MAG733B]|uniref:RHS repeat-associated core domain-containing protein n=1 Tax=Pseudomonas sp. MAG733B TaxID=3122079 RepID=UPI0030CFF8EF